MTLSFSKEIGGYFELEIDSKNIIEIDRNLISKATKYIDF